MRCLLLAFALGVLALQQQAELPSAARAVWIALPLAIALLFYGVAIRASTGWRRRAASCGAVLSPAVAIGLGGFFYAAWRAETRLADELPRIWEGRDVEIVGVIDELPQAQERGKRFALAVEQVLTPGAIIPSRLSLGWYASWRDESHAADIPELHAGERWNLTVRLKRPHGTVNPQGFDVEAWLLENEFRATGYVRDNDANRRLDEFAGRPDDYVARLRETIRTRILTALGGRPYAGVIAALAIGDERAIPNEQWRIFFRTGIGHLISISGLHVTAFATLIGGVAFWLWRRSHRLTLVLPARKAAAVTVGLLPLMLRLFQPISLVSPLANSVAIPVVTFIVVPLTLASVVLPLDLLLIAAHQVFAWLALLLEALSALPAAVWQQHAPPVWAVVAGAAGVLWLLAPRGVPGRAFGFAWLLPLFLIVPLLPPPGTFRVTVLDV